MHHKKAMSHMKKAMEHLSMHHDAEGGQPVAHKKAKKHEAKAGRKANKMKKHHMAEAMGMKKAMMRGM